MRRRITAFFMGAAVLTATLMTGPAAMAEERREGPVRPEKQVAFPSSYPYTARVHTPHVVGASTTATVWMRLHGSDNTALVLLGGNLAGVQFKSYSLSRYLGRINTICVYRNNLGLSPNWRLREIKVNDTRRAVWGTTFFGEAIPAFQWRCKPTQL